MANFVLVQNGLALARVEIVAWCLGKDPSSVDDEVLRNLARAFEAVEHSLVARQTFVVNFTRITQDDSTVDGWMEFCNQLPKNFALALCDCSFSLQSDFSFKIGRSYQWSKSSESLLYLSNESENDADFEQSSVVLAEDAYLKQQVKDCYVTFNEYKSSQVVEVRNGMGRLRSTKMWASGYFDATRMLGDPDVFPWLVSKLTDQIELVFAEIVEREKRFDPVVRLLACTRNGAVLAAASRRLLPDVDTVVLDVVERFAPAHAPIEYYDGSSGLSQGINHAQQPFERYIYIGDFVIVGTELQLARLHGLYRGIPVEGAVVIGNVAEVDALTNETVSETLTPTCTNVCRVQSLFSLTEVCPSLRYQFPNVETD